MTIAQLPLPEFLRSRAARPSEPKRGLLIDVFAGFGGASIASERAHGRPVDKAINHWSEAIRLHERNHPHPTQHITSDVWEVDPLEATRGEPVAHIHFSPDCRHHSNARGGTPVSDGVRCLAWVILRWAKQCSPELITCENVREFLNWGPTIPIMKGGKFQRDKNGDVLRMPCPKRKGVTFKIWLGRLRALGYTVDWKVLDAAAYGAPTHRKRLFLVARRDGKPVVWPEPTHGPVEKCNDSSRTNSGLGGSGQGSFAYEGTRESEGQTVESRQRDGSRYSKASGEGLETPPVRQHPDRTGLKSYRSAAECIDFTRPCPSIFMTARDAEAYRKATGTRCNRPLAPKSLWRIANGVVRHVIKAQKPFIVQTGYSERQGQGPRVDDIAKPLGTVVASSNKRAVVTPEAAEFITRCAHGEESKGAKRWGNSTHGVDQSLPTVTGSKDFALTATALAKFYGSGDGKTGAAMTQPLGTVPTHDRFGLIAGNLVCVNHGGNEPRDGKLSKPLTAVTGKHGYGVSSAHLIKFRGDSEGTPATAPVPTITAGQGAARDAGAPHALGLSSATLVEVQNSGNATGSRAVDRPAPTIMANPKGGGWAMSNVTMVPFVLKHFGGVTDHGVERPLGTVTTVDHHGLAAGHIIHFHTEKGTETRASSPTDPLPTQDTSNRFGTVAAFLAKLRGSGGWKPCDLPLDVICAGAPTFAPVAVFLDQWYGTSRGSSIAKPLSTITAQAGGGHLGAIHAFLSQGVDEKSLAGFWRVYSFLVDQLGPDAPLPMIVVDGSLYLIVDIGMRMLEPRELLNAQFTPELAKDYVLPVHTKGKFKGEVIKSLAVALIGNSVSPPVLEAVLRANGVKPDRRKRRAAA